MLIYTYPNKIRNEVLYEYTGKKNKRRNNSVLDAREWIITQRNKVIIGRITPIIKQLPLIKKGLHMKQHQTNASRLTRDIMIFDLMNTMGWTRSRAIAAIEELEQAHLVYFSEAGGLRLQVVGGF